MALTDIEHIVFLMLENRSFDHMLGYLSLDETPNPLPVDGLRSDLAWRQATANYSQDGTAYPVRPIDAGEKIPDPPPGPERVPNKIKISALVRGQRRSCDVA